MEMEYDESGWQQGRPKQRGEDEVCSADICCSEKTKKAFV